MKKIGEYTIRGTVPPLDSAGHRVILFDGKFTTGYKITKVFCSAMDPTDVNDDCVIAVGTEPDLGATGTWNWADNREIGWASSNDSNGAAGTPQGGMVDPDNLVIEDLYIYGRNDDSGNTTEINYMVHLEKYEINEFQGLISIIRNKSQGL
jgi:hypothetical protein